MESTSTKGKAVLLLMIAGVLWSTGGVMIKELNANGWTGAQIFVVRCFFSSALLLVYLRKIPTRLSKWTLIAAVSHSLTALLFVVSTTMTTAANSIFLQYTGPLYIVVFAYLFLRERPSRMDWIAMAVIFAGMTLFFFDQLRPEGFWGNVLALLSGVTMAIMAVSLRAQKDGSPAESILIAHVATAVIGLGLWAAFDRQPLNFGTWNFARIAYLGLVQIGLAFILYTTGIKHVNALEATLLNTVEPILNPLWVLLFVGEQPGQFASIGGLVVIVGVAISALGAMRAKPIQAPLSMD